MALTEQEAEAIRADHQAGLSYRKIAKKYHKAQRDIRDALLGSASSSASKSATGSPAKPPAPATQASPPEYPLVNVPRIPRQDWTPIRTRAVEWVYVGPLHVTIETLALYNFWHERIASDMTFDEFASHCIEEYFRIGGLAPMIGPVTEGSHGSIKEGSATPAAESGRVATPGGEQRGSGPQ